MALVCLIMTLVCNKFDDEMEALADEHKQGKISVKE